MQKPIEEATATELAHFAENIQNLENINLRLGAEKIIAKLRDAGYTKDFILIPDAPPENESDETDAAENILKSGSKVEILIPKSEGPGGSQPVSVSVEGKAMVIPRGEKCTVPVEFVEALNLAMETHYPDANEEDLGDPVDMPSYSVQQFGLV